MDKEKIKYSYETTCPNCKAEISSETCQKNKDGEGYICNFCGTVA